MNAIVRPIKPVFIPSDEQLDVVIQHLRDLASGKAEPLYISEGICFEIKQMFGVPMMTYIMAAAQYWEHYTGNPMYPVPDPFTHDAGDPKAAAETRFKHTQDVWRGRYGNYRRNLCSFLASYHNGDN